MSDLVELVDRYMDMWNETDAVKRRILIGRIWSERATYVDPLMESVGQAGIDAMVAGVQDRFPGLRFRRTSDVDVHHDRVRFGWELGPEGGPAVARGVDFGVLSADQRLETLTGFIDHAPGMTA